MLLSFTMSKFRHKVHERRRGSAGIRLPFDFLKHGEASLRHLSVSLFDDDDDNNNNVEEVKGKIVPVVN
jgi:hypothetical protein